MALNLSMIMPPDYGDITPSNNLGNNLSPELINALLSLIQNQPGQSNPNNQIENNNQNFNLNGQGNNPIDKQFNDYSTQGQIGWEELKKLAQQTFPNNPVMQKVALSQLALESGTPRNFSGLARKNNFFGIKGPGTSMRTQEDYGNGLQNVTDSFAVNNSPMASFQQYSNLLNNPRYASVLAANNPEEAFNALQSAGYATDKNYSKKLLNVFNKTINPLF